MIIGRGQLAKEFSRIDRDDWLVFASGVANSKCVDNKEFEREERLLKSHLAQSKGKKFIYFSSCALSAGVYKDIPYYKHKMNMERLIMEHAACYYIFRLPQLFGDMKQHPTLINYLWNKIVSQERFPLFTDAYRYVIELSDVRILIEKVVIANKNGGLIMNVANPYRYSVMEIVEVIEELAGISALPDMVKKSDGYILPLNKIEDNLSCESLELGFGKAYLRNKLNKHVEYLANGVT